jgi:hypothetical protein
MSTTHRLNLPPLPPSAFRTLPRDALLAHIAGLELENLRLARAVEFQAEELRLTRARERHLSRKLAER